MVQEFFRERGRIFCQLLRLLPTGAYIPVTDTYRENRLNQ